MNWTHHTTHTAFPFVFHFFFSFHFSYFHCEMGIERHLMKHIIFLFDGEHSGSVWRSTLGPLLLFLCYCCPVCVCVCYIEPVAFLAFSYQPRSFYIFFYIIVWRCLAYPTVSSHTLCITHRPASHSFGKSISIFKQYHIKKNVCAIYYAIGGEDGWRGVRPKRSSGVGERGYDAARIDSEMGIWRESCYLMVGSVHFKMCIIYTW